MKILIVASYNKQRFAPFVVEQAEALQQAGVEVEFYGVVGKGVMGYLKARKGLMQHIRTYQPDIIHAHFGLSGLLANLQRRVPVVTTYHGSDINVPKILRLSKIAMHLSAYNIFVSQRNMNTIFPSHGGIRGGLLPCGVNLDNFAPRTREEARKELGWNLEDKKILFAGAFDNTVKNAPLAQAAIQHLNLRTSEPLNSSTLRTFEPSTPSNLRTFEPSTPSNLRTFEPSTPSNLRTFEPSTPSTLRTFEPSTPSNLRTSEPSTPSNLRTFEPSTPLNLRTFEPLNYQLVELRGYDRTQIASLFYASDALLMTSFTEGSPQVVKEAIACGCPIVSVDVGDVAERIAGIDHCYIAKRTPEDIADKLARVLESAAHLSPSIGESEGAILGRQQIREMGLDNQQIAQKLVGIYTQIILPSIH